jgi:hypothetical protein
LSIFQLRESYKTQKLVACYGMFVGSAVKLVSHLLFGLPSESAKYFDFLPKASVISTVSETLLKKKTVPEAPFC